MPSGSWCADAVPARARVANSFQKKKKWPAIVSSSRKRVLFKSRVGASVERGDCWGGRGRFGDIFFLLFLPISPSLSIAVQESKEECKGQLGLNTLFSFLSLSLSLSWVNWKVPFIYIFRVEIRFVSLQHQERDFGQREATEARRTTGECDEQKTLREESVKQHAATCRKVWTSDNLLDSGSRGRKAPLCASWWKTAKWYLKKKYLTDANL